MNCRRTCLLLLTIFSLSGAPGFAQDEVSVETISGEKRSGSLERIDSSGDFVGSGLDGINMEQVLSISTSRQPTAVSGSAGLGLVGGGQLTVSNVNVDGESVSFSKNAIGLESISLQAVRSIVFVDNKLVREAVQKSATEEDTVIVLKESSLSRVAGVLESLDAGNVQFNFKGKSRAINRQKRKIAAVVIADLDLAPPQGFIATASFTDGSIIKGAFVSCDKSSISIELVGKQLVSIDRKFLVRVDISSDSLAYLSALDPVEVQHRPQFTVSRQWQRNRSVEGNPIRLLSKVENSTSAETTQIATFDNGIGVSSWSRIVFENTNDFSRFQATVGIDAETEGRGDCEMRVEGDGITLWSQRIRGGEVAIDVDVDISGISQIALIVDPGEQFDLADHADWARARFLKTD
jgi:hypothetical protein